MGEFGYGVEIHRSVKFEESLNLYKRLSEG
jgi:hypothetical protein